MRKRTATVVQHTPPAGVDTLLRGLEALRSFRVGESALRASEIAQRIGVPLPSTERLLASLSAQGFLQPVPETDLYRPHVACLVVGHALLRGMPEARIARPLMQKFAERFGAHLVLGVRERLDMLCLVHCEGSSSEPAALGAGARLPIANTAFGRAWLWSQPAAAQALLMREIRDQQAEQGARTAAAIYRAFQELEERGFCVSFGESQRDLTGAAVPIARTDAPHLALACKLNSAQQVPTDLITAIGPALRELGAKLRDTLLRSAP